MVELIGSIQFLTDLNHFQIGDIYIYMIVPKKSACTSPGRGPRERILNKAQNGSHAGNPAHDDALITPKARVQG